MAAAHDVYRGATILDLDPPPSLSLVPDTPIRTALDLAYERDYTHLCVVSKTRALLGYVSIPHLSSLLSPAPASASSNHAPSPGLKNTDPVSKAMQRFRRSKSGDTNADKDGYTVITPDTALKELEDFFAGRGSHKEEQDFAIVTDAGRKFVVGVVTKNDLQQWLERRGG